MANAQTTGTDASVSAHVAQLDNSGTTKFNNGVTEIADRHLADIGSAPGAAQTAKRGNEGPPTTRPRKDSPRAPTMCKRRDVVSQANVNPEARKRPHERGRDRLFGCRFHWLEFDKAKAPRRPLRHSTRWRK